MKSYLNSAILLAGVMGFGAAAAWGQRITANVPFGFHVTNTEMPAGEYSVKQLHSGSPVLVLNNWRAHKTAMLLAQPLSASADTRPRMIFHCGENGCTLAEVWGATASAGVQVSPPPSWSPRNREHIRAVYADKKQAEK